MSRLKFILFLAIFLVVQLNNTSANDNDDYYRDVNENEKSTTEKIQFIDDLNVGVTKDKDILVLDDSGIELRKDPVKTQESDSNTKNQTDKEEKLMFQQTETAAADQITTKIVEPTSAGINIKSENIDYSKTLNYENIDELTIIKSEATSTTTTKYEEPTSLKDSILPSGIEATKDINAIIEPEITDQTDPEIGNINESNVIKSEAMTTTTKSEESMSLKDSIVPNEIKTTKDISIVIESESTDQADLKTENNIMSTLVIQTKVTITKSEEQMSLKKLGSKFPYEIEARKNNNNVIIEIEPDYENEDEYEEVTQLKDSNSQSKTTTISPKELTRKIVTEKPIKKSEIKNISAYQMEQERRIQSVKQRLYALIIVFAVLASVLVLSLTGIIAFILVQRKNRRAKQNSRPKTNIVKNRDTYKSVNQQEI